MQKEIFMLLIDESINGTISKVGRAILERNDTFVRELAKVQYDCGANFLEVNAKWQNKYCGHGKISLKGLLLRNKRIQKSYFLQDHQVKKGESYETVIVDHRFVPHRLRIGHGS